MRGDDVRRLQTAVNNRLAAFGRRFEGVKVDGQYGPHTQDEVRRVAWWLGVANKHIEGPTPPWVQRLIEHPGLRNPVQRARARARKPKKIAGPTAVIAWEKTKVGLKESPAGSNWGPGVSTFLKLWGLGPAPWCGAFQGYGLKEIGHVPVTGRITYCPYIVEDAKAGRNGFSGWHSWSDRRNGDLVLCSFDGSGVAEHVEMVVDAASGQTIGGNTSSDEAGSQSNGGMVAYKHRPSTVILGVARPRW